MNERDTKPELPTHFILRASDYVKIKIQKCRKVGNRNESIAQQTKVGRLGMFPGRENDLVSLLDTRRSVRDFDRLSDIDVLGVGENLLNHNENLCKKLKQQL